jgi:hypothetical protein
VTRMGSYRSERRVGVMDLLSERMWVEPSPQTGVSEDG